MSCIWALLGGGGGPCDSSSGVADSQQRTSPPNWGPVPSRVLHGLPVCQQSPSLRATRPTRGKQYTPGGFPGRARGGMLAPEKDPSHPPQHWTKKKVAPASFFLKKKICNHARQDRSPRMPINPLLKDPGPLASHFVKTLKKGTS